jgi:hypothetical protein
MFIVNIFQQDLKCWENLAPNFLFKDISKYVVQYTKFVHDWNMKQTFMKFAGVSRNSVFLQQELSIPSAVSQYIPWREAESSLSGNRIVRRQEFTITPMHTL